MSAAFRSVELKPVAAVSVLLRSGAEELQVRGPIQISLPLGRGTRLRAADTVPAWTFDPDTGEKREDLAGGPSEPNPRAAQRGRSRVPLGFDVLRTPGSVFPEGAWENQGLGIVRSVGERLVWTYTASHLGHWMAAPLPSSDGTSGSRRRGDFTPCLLCLSALDDPGHGGSVDFPSYHTYLLMGVLGGTLAAVVGSLSLLLCHCRYPTLLLPLGLVFAFG